MFTLNSKLKANVVHENVKLNHRYTLPYPLSHHPTLPIRQYTTRRPLHATVPFSPTHATVSLPRTRLATLMSFTDRFRPAYPPPLSTAGHQRRSDTASQDIRPCPRQDVTHGRDKLINYTSLQVKVFTVFGTLLQVKSTTQVLCYNTSLLLLRYCTTLLAAHYCAASC